MLRMGEGSINVGGEPILLIQLIRRIPKNGSACDLRSVR